MSDERDVERAYSTSETVAKLRRLADALETDAPFRIQIAGERIRVPRHARFSIEHERSGDEEEIEFQLTWDLADVSSSSASSEDDDDEPVVAL
jgi:amphi-Trp domain-containing protein